MLEKLQFENFKSWARADVPFGRITGLFGTNSSGKTSLMQFLLLLKQTKEATDRTISLDLNGQYVSLGSYSDMIHDHTDTLPLRWTVEFSTAEAVTISDPSASRTKAIAKSNAIITTGQVCKSATGPRTQFLSYAVGGQKFTLSPKKTDENAFDLKATGSADFKFIRTPGRAWQLPGPIRSYAFPDQARTYFQNASFLADLEKAYEEQIDRVYYLGPLREYPKREYTWARTKPRDVGIRGEKVVDAILAATVAREYRNLKPKGRLKGFQEMVAHWLIHLGLIEEFSVEELAPGSNYWQARVIVKKGGASALLTDVGFGVSQVLPIITLLYYVPEGSTVILEQPEIHLHPSAQAQLADLLVNVSQHRNIQIIFESHSEHLLLRLQRHVAEGTLTNDEMKLFFCSIDANTSKIDQLDVDVFGEIRNWPDKFMGDAFGETVAAERARLKRMKAQK